MRAISSWRVCIMKRKWCTKAKTPSWARWGKSRSSWSSQLMKIRGAPWATWAPAETRWSKAVVRPPLGIPKSKDSTRGIVLSCPRTNLNHMRISLCHISRLRNSITIRIWGVWDHQKWWQLTNSTRLVLKTLEPQPTANLILIHHNNLIKMKAWCFRFSSQTTMNRHNQIISTAIVVSIWRSTKQLEIIKQTKIRGKIFSPRRPVLWIEWSIWKSSLSKT